MNEPTPSFFGKLTHYVEAFPNILEHSPKIFGRILRGVVLSGAMSSVQASVYGVSTFHTLGTWVEKTPVFDGEAAWASFSELQEDPPRVEGVGTTSSISDVIIQDLYPEAQGYIEGVAPSKLYVKAPKSSLWSVIEQARPLYGYLVSPQAETFGILATDGIPQEWVISSKNSLVKSRIAVGYDGRAEILEGKVKLSGIGSPYSIARFWGIRIPVLQGLVGKTQGVSDIAARFAEIQPSVFGNGAPFLSNIIPSFTSSFVCVVPIQTIINAKVIMYAESGVLSCKESKTHVSFFVQSQYSIQCVLGDSTGIIEGVGLSGRAFSLSCEDQWAFSGSVMAGTQGRLAVSQVLVDEVQGFVARGQDQHATVFDYNYSVTGVFNEYISFC